VVVGALAGFAVARRLRGGWPVSRLALVGLAAGPIAAAVLALAGSSAAGALGSELLAHIGDVGWQYPVVCGLGIGAGAMIGALASVLVRRDARSASGLG
jgi:hypothetical protein